MRQEYEDPFKNFFKWIIVTVILFLLMVGILAGVSISEINKACERRGMTMTGNMDCRKGNEFYEVYSKEPFSFEMIANKYPKTEE